MVQAPQTWTSQETLVPVRPSWPRTTSATVACGAKLRCCSRPLIRVVIVMRPGVLAACSDDETGVVVIRPGLPTG